MREVWPLTESINLLWLEGGEGAVDSFCSPFFRSKSIQNIKFPSNFDLNRTGCWGYKN